MPARAGAASRLAGHSVVPGDAGAGTGIRTGSRAETSSPAPATPGRPTPGRPTRAAPTTAPGNRRALVTARSRRRPGSPHRTGMVWWTRTRTLAGAGAVLAGWAVIAGFGRRPPHVLQGPVAVASRLAGLAGSEEFWSSLATTTLRALAGFAVAIALGTLLGLAVCRFRTLRVVTGPALTGLQTMPSITWFPLAILLFRPSEQAITSVVVLAATPSIAHGLISGLDHVPAAFTRLAAVLGARGRHAYRHVVLPAALPTYVTGLNQGWAYAWRSLMAGELLVASRPSLGGRLASARASGDATLLIAYMLVILVVGMLAAATFAAISRRLRRRRGLMES